ncbi:MAG: DUF805 domain-containing protein [Lactobacillales bacterium]|nr:DUF805 domain-containing protein [Lactobacillales bacterium]
MIKDERKEKNMFKKAWRQYWSGYKNFSGVTTRSEYWCMILILLCLNLSIGFFSGLIGTKIFKLIWVIVTILPSTALSIRRFHDAGKSTCLWVLFHLGPIICLTIFLPISALNLSVNSSLFLGIILSSGVSFVLSIWSFVITLLPSK